MAGSYSQVGISILDCCLCQEVGRFLVSASLDCAHLAHHWMVGYVEVNVIWTIPHYSHLHSVLDNALTGIIR